MKKLRQIISAALTAILILPAAPFSARAESGGEPARVSYIVETDGTALLMRSAAATLGAEEYLDSRSGQAAADALVSMQDEIVSEIKDTVDPSAEVGYTYTTVFSGFSIEIAEGTEEDILALPGVKNIYPVYEYKFVNPDVVVDPEDYPDTLDNCCEMMGIDKMHESGYDGTGQVVAVIDTELDVSHPMFTEAPQDPKYSEDDINTVITNNNMSRKLTADEVYRSAKIPFAYSYGKGQEDVYSSNPDVIHGTHVSGIAVGKNGTLPDGSSFSGAAPEAQLIFFGVTNANGIMRNDVIIAALNDAVLFGVSAVNISLGSDYVFKDTPFVTAVDNAEDAGITVSISSGNAARGNALSDDTRVFAEHPDNGAIDSPSSISSSFSVASADNTYAWVLANKAVLSDKSGIPFKDVDRFVDTFKNSGAIEYVHCGTGTDLSNVNLDGKLALIDRGDIDFETKAAAAKEAGAAGVIFASLNEDISWVPSYTTDIPSALVSASTRNTLVAAAEKSLTVTDETMTSQSSYPNAVSSYSSWGPNASLELKPDITAPGGNIYSAYPDSEYKVLSGTSMAAPHITGAAALITQYMDENNIEKTGSARTAFIKNLLASGADIITDETYGLPYSPRAQGAGLADVYDAINIPVILKGEDGTTKVSLYDDLENNFTVSFTAENLTNEPVTYNTIDMTVQTDYAAEDTDGTMIVSGEQAIDHTAELPASVIVPANSKQEISINVALDSAAVSGLESVFTNGFYVEGFVTLSDSTGKNAQVNIPYMGFHGDWTDAPAFDAPYYSEDSVYGRTYLGSGSGSCSKSMEKDTCAVLGTNPLVKLKGAELSGDASEYEGEQYAGISPNGDGNYDYLCIPISPLRTLENTVAGIYDADDSLKTRILNSGYTDKYYQTHFDFDFDDLSALPEGDYTVIASGSLPYGDTETETIEMDFYIDKSAPALTKAELSDDKTTLTLAASDERYIAGFVISDGNNEKVIAVMPAPERETTVDVSDMSTENLTVTVYDYAANTRNISLNNSETHAKVNNTEAYIEPVYIEAKAFNGLTSDGMIDKSDTASLADNITITAGNCAVTGINVFLKDDTTETDRIVGRTESNTAPGTATGEEGTEQTITIAGSSSVTIAVILDGIEADEIGIQVIE